MYFIFDIIPQIIALKQSMYHGMMSNKKILLTYYNIKYTRTKIYSYMNLTYKKILHQTIESLRYQIIKTRVGKIIHTNFLNGNELYVKYLYAGVESKPTDV